jgi:hypothetical protein
MRPQKANMNSEFPAVESAILGHQRAREACELAIVNRMAAMPIYGSQLFAVLNIKLHDLNCQVIADTCDVARLYAIQCGRLPSRAGLSKCASNEMSRLGLMGCFTSSLCWTPQNISNLFSDFMPRWMVADIGAWADELKSIDAHIEELNSLIVCPAPTFQSMERRVLSQRPTRKPSQQVA